jgi:hypothetical protein
MTTRKYSSRAQQTTLSSGISSTDVTMTVGSGSALMGGKTPTSVQTYTVVIDPDTALEEIVDVSNYSTGNSITITRAIDGSTAVAHSAGAVVRHMVIGRDLQETNDHIEGTTTAHGLTLANLVKTTDTGIITSSMILDGTIVAADIANSTITAAKMVTDPYARVNHTGTQTANTISDFDTQVRTSRLDQMAAPTSSFSMNSQKITSLATPTLSTDASTKAYVDTSISNLVGSAPSTLDTLAEIATALNNTANFSDTVVLKTGSTMSGALAMGTNKITGVGNPTLAQDVVTKNYLESVTLAPSNLTGPITSAGSATSIASQTGTGTKFVVDTSPTLITPVLGIATATSINSTIIPSSKTLVATDSTAYVVPSQTGNSGKYLTTNGTTSSWGTIDTTSNADIIMTIMGAY